MGRPKKYTVAGLSKQIEKYFQSISRTVDATERHYTGEKDGDGHKIYEDRPILNDAGEKIRYTEYIIPPTVSGLCEYLCIHRSTWAEYCNPEYHPEFSDTTTRTRGRIRAWLEQQLLSRKDVKGIIFDLQNNHGYSDKQEIELGPRASKKFDSISMSEREELLKELAREFGGPEKGDE